MKISDLPPTEDSNLLLSVQLETEVDPGQKSNKRKKTELYCNLLHLNDTNDMEVRDKKKRQLAMEIFAGPKPRGPCHFHCHPHKPAKD